MQPDTPERNPGETYSCEICGRRFIKGWTDDEAESESQVLGNGRSGPTRHYVRYLLPIDDEVAEGLTLTFRSRWKRRSGKMDLFRNVIFF